MTQKKRIAVIGLKGLPAFGGAAAVGENLIAQLKNDYDFTVLCISSHTHLKTSDYNGVKQVVFKSFLGKGGLNTAYYYFVSLLYVLCHKFDITHLHHAASGFIVPLIRLKTKTVLTVHAYGEGNDPKFNRFLNYLGMVSRKIAIQSSHKVTAVSLYDTELMRNAFNKEIIYIPNGTNLTECIEENNTTNPYVLFSAGRIYNIKGLHLLLEAANKINLKNMIKVAGNLDRVPSYKQEVLQGIKTLNVDIVGMIKEKRELMQIVNKAELFVFPSLYEAMSMMLLEVASMKTPIIASDIPANKAVFTSDEVLFFKSGDTEDLATKMQYAFSHMEKMRERAEKAYTKLIDNYTWAKIAQQYQAIYNKF